MRVKITELEKRGIEVLPRGNAEIVLPKHTILEAPCSLKWTQYEYSLTLGAFSYQVSGYCCAADVGRYCSFGENVQIGRQSHPMSWLSTSPTFYLNHKLFDVGNEFEQAEAYHGFTPEKFPNPTNAKKTSIGNDVWIGHGAQIMAGITIGDGAVIAAGSVVAKNVPPYSVVAGNPAVIKKTRVPAELVSPMLRSKWWRFAPWQLKGLNHSDPKLFLQEFFVRVKDLEVYAPTKLKLHEL